MRKTYFTEDTELHILKGFGYDLLLDKLVVRYMKNFPLWGYKDIWEYSIDALEYLKKQFPKYAKSKKLERRDNFYLFCTKYLTIFAHNVHKKYLKNKIS